jgi:hypothetical protein
MIMIVLENIPRCRMAKAYLLPAIQMQYYLQIGDNDTFPPGMRKK